MACPVNHPLFHALVFLIGVLVVLSRYARAAESSWIHPSHAGLLQSSQTGTFTPALLDPAGGDWMETMLSLTGGVGIGAILSTMNAGRGRSGGRTRSRKTTAGNEDLNAHVFRRRLVK